MKPAVLDSYRPGPLWPGTDWGVDLTACPVFSVSVRATVRQAEAAGEAR